MSGPDREQRLAEIAAVGRDTRKPLSRGLWIAALIVGAIGAIGFAVVMLAEPAPPSAMPRRLERVASRDDRGGLGIGLWIAGGAVIAIGFAIARQRAAHSSRNSP